MNKEKSILKYLSENKRKIKYKGMHVSLLGLPDFKYYKYQTLANRCSNLKTKGYIKEKNGEYFITRKGKDFLNKETKKNFKKFQTNKTKNDFKNLLLLYDIPENKKSHRNWFRRELINLHFVMIQKSVWVGPSPLPSGFIEYVKSIGLKDMIKIFKLKKGYNLSNFK